MGLPAYPLSLSGAPAPEGRVQLPKASKHQCPTGTVVSLCSKVEAVREGTMKSLLQACFWSVFLLPPRRDMQGPVATLYFDVSAG